MQKPRDEQIHIRVKAAEKLKFEQLAEQNNMKLSEFIRFVMNREVRSVKGQAA